MHPVARLAAELQVPERTLRRAVKLGTIRARRLSPRRIRLAAGESDYLKRHWKLLAQLRAALRNEPRVRLAVLFGSVARGDDGPGSDLDLLVEISDEQPLDALQLGIRLSDKIGCEVEVASLPRTERDDPFTMLQGLDEGRVIVDRYGAWPALRARRSAVYARARRSFNRQVQRTAALLADATGQ